MPFFHPNHCTKLKILRFLTEFLTNNSWWIHGPGLVGRNRPRVEVDIFKRERAPGRLPPPGMPLHPSCHGGGRRRSEGRRRAVWKGMTGAWGCSVRLAELSRSRRCLPPPGTPLPLLCHGGGHGVVSGRRQAGRRGMTGAWEWQSAGGGRPRPACRIPRRVTAGAVL